MTTKPSNMQGARKDYAIMYDLIKNWNSSPFEDTKNNHYLYDLGYALDDMKYYGWIGEEAKNERFHYEEICKAHSALKLALENALGIDKKGKSSNV